MRRRERGRWEVVGERVGGEKRYCYLRPRVGSMGGAGQTRNDWFLFLGTADEEAVSSMAAESRLCRL